MRLLPVVLCGALVACGTSPARQALMDEFRQTIPVCASEVQCEAMWGAAQVWVANNSAYQLQIVTDSVMSTYNNGPTTTALAVQVTKEAIGGGQHRIVVRTGCNNIFACIPDAWTAAVDFNRYVNSASQ